MKTKFMTLEREKKETKKTKFTHVISSKTEIEETNVFYPTSFDNVLWIGFNNFYGDVFKAWDNGRENNFVIYFGEKGDEF